MALDTTGIGPAKPRNLVVKTTAGNGAGPNDTLGETILALFVVILKILLLLIIVDCASIDRLLPELIENALCEL